MKKIALAAIAALMASGASAATVTTNTIAPTYDGKLQAPTSVSGVVRLNLQDNELDGAPPESRSPWDTLPNKATGYYHSVQVGSQAFYDFAELQTSFSVMWGSPDTYNTIVFRKNNQTEFSLNGGQLGLAQGQLGKGFVNVLVTDIEFDRVVFRNGGSDAFEYANVAPVPLPAAAWMLVAGLGGIGLLSRKRKS